MKHLHDHDDDDTTAAENWAVFKRVKRTELFETCAQEWAFFCSLWPYEKQRWLCAFIALRDEMPRDVTRLILVDWMHLQCAARQCGSRYAPLTTRFYFPCDGEALYAAMRQQVIEYHTNKVERERAARLAEGVSPVDLCIVNANQPYDGQGAILPYDPLFMDRHFWVAYISLPPNTDYTCLDINDTTSILVRLKEDALREFHTKRHAKTLVDWFSDFFK